MTINEAYIVLGLNPPASESDIRSAYAQKCHIYNPESAPGKWMRIHEAYKLLLNFHKSELSDKTKILDKYKVSTKSRISFSDTDVWNEYQQGEDVSVEFSDLFEELESENFHDDEMPEILKQESKEILTDWVHTVCTLKKKEYLEKDKVQEIFKSQEYHNLKGSAELVETLLPLYQVNAFKVRRDASDYLEKQATKLIKTPGLSKQANRILKIKADNYWRELLRSHENKPVNVKGELITTLLYLMDLVLLTIVPIFILYLINQYGGTKAMILCYYLCLLCGSFRILMKKASQYEILINPLIWLMSGTIMSSFYFVLLFMGFFN